MTYTDILLYYCAKKSEILYNKTGTHLYNSKDYENLANTFTEKDSRIFLEGLKNAYTDFEICPQCFKYVNCSDCLYFSNHNNNTCGMAKNPYYIIIQRIPGSVGARIIEIPLIQELLEDIIEMVSRKSK